MLEGVTSTKFKDVKEIVQRCSGWDGMSERDYRNQKNVNLLISSYFKKSSRCITEKYPSTDFTSTSSRQTNQLLQVEAHRKLLKTAKEKTQMKVTHIVGRDG